MSNYKNIDTATGQFLRLSACYSGFSKAELQGTGLAGEYYKVLNSIIDSSILGALWLEFERRIDLSDSDSETACRELLEDPKFGPVIKNIVTLWYLGQWNQMPSPWRNEFGASALDRDYVISAQSYKQGLVWTAMGAHPMGTKQQGYGAWSLPPPNPQG